MQAFRQREPDNHRAAYVWARVTAVILFGLVAPWIFIVMDSVVAALGLYGWPALTALGWVCLLYIALLRRMISHAKENHLRAFVERLLDHQENLFCPECGYALRLIENPDCPECGTPRPTSAYSYVR